MSLRSRVVSGAAVLLAPASLVTAAVMLPPSAAATAPVQVTRLGEPSPSSSLVASSTSWTSARDGWLLGFRVCSQDGRKRCGTLLHTTDGGATWQKTAVPRVRVSPRFLQVKIVFARGARAAKPDTGLASDGRRLFMTTDGARTWQQASLGGSPSVGDIALTDTSAYAIIGKGTTDAGTTSLYSTPRGSSSWAPVPKVHTAGNGVNIDGGYDLAARGNHAAVALGRIFVDTGYWRTDDGSTWTKLPAPCRSDQLPSLNWVGAHRTVATCSYNPGMSHQFKDVRQSVDGGAFTTTSSAPLDLYSTGTGAANSQRPFIGATGAGVSWLYATFDKGASWQTVLRIDDELPFHDIQFVSPRRGFLVSGGSAFGRGAVYSTVDGGHTWQVLAIG